MELICPVCGEELTCRGNRWVCGSNHSFDVARQGYVNLLPVQQKRSLHPGDTKEQVQARRRFLDCGFYKPLADALCKMAEGLTGPILDAGCGEGYYSACLADLLGAELVGLDISKEAVRCAAARYKNALWLCSSAARLPVKDHSIGLVTSLFALTVPEEFHRALRADGAFLQVLAQEDHLLGLKSVIYPELLRKPKQTQKELPGFCLEKSLPVKFTFTAEGQQVRDLLSMTPHVFRISRQGAENLEKTQRLTDTASCIINLYRPL